MHSCEGHKGVSLSALSSERKELKKQPAFGRGTAPDGTSPHCVSVGIDIQRLNPESINFILSDP